MVDTLDDFKKYEEIISRMVKEFRGGTTGRLMLPPGEKEEIVPSESRLPEKKKSIEIK